MAAQPVTVRLARREDMPTIHKMINDLAVYEGVPDGPELTADDLVKDGFDSNPPWFFALLAEHAGEVMGYAICNRAYSSWTRRAFYIEDLYVRESARRLGIGMALVRRVCAIAAAEGANRIDWHVLEDNPPARAFYARLGAQDLRVTEGRTAMRLRTEHIRRLAAEDTA